MEGRGSLCAQGPQQVVHALPSTRTILNRPFSATLGVLEGANPKMDGTLWVHVDQSTLQKGSWQLLAAVSYCGPGSGSRGVPLCKELSNRLWVKCWVLGASSEKRESEECVCVCVLAGYFTGII